MKRSGPTLVPSLVLALVGVALGLYGLIGAMATWNSPEVEAPIGSMVVIFVGASMFAVGAMMVLAVMARPLFEERVADPVAVELAGAMNQRREP